MKLYINSLTVNSIKVLLVCNALKITPEFEEIALNKNEQSSDKFLTINPEGKVPVLQIGEVLLPESNAILQYLANIHNSSLWPIDFTAQAKVLRFMFWQASYFNTGVSSLAHHKVVMPFWGFGAQEIDIDKWAQFHLAMGALEQVLKGSAFVAAETITIADISLAAYFIFADESEMPLEQYPITQAWLKTIAIQPWFSRTKAYLDNILSK